MVTNVPSKESPARYLLSSGPVLVGFTEYQCTTGTVELPVFLSLSGVAVNSFHPRTGVSGSTARACWPSPTGPWRISRLV